MAWTRRSTDAHMKPVYVGTTRSDWALTAVLLAVVAALFVVDSAAGDLGLKAIRCHALNGSLRILRCTVPRKRV